VDFYFVRRVPHQSGNKNEVGKSLKYSQLTYEHICSALTYYHTAFSSNAAKIVAQHVARKMVGAKTRTPS